MAVASLVPLRETLRSTMDSCVLLTTAEEWDAWLTGSIGEAVALQRPLPNDLLRIVATREKSDRAPVDE